MSKGLRPSPPRNAPMGPDKRLTLPWDPTLHVYTEDGTCEKEQSNVLVLGQINHHLKCYHCDTSVWYSPGCASPSLCTERWTYAELQRVHPLANEPVTSGDVAARLVLEQVIASRGVAVLVERHRRACAACVRDAGIHVSRQGFHTVYYSILSPVYFSTSDCWVQIVLYVIKHHSIMI